jgi:hypothetical protein
MSQIEQKNLAVRGTGHGAELHGDDGQCVDPAVRRHGGSFREDLCFSSAEDERIRRNLWYCKMQGQDAAVATQAVVTPISLLNKGRDKGRDLIRGRADLQLQPQFSVSY